MSYHSESSPSNALEASISGLTSYFDPSKPVGFCIYCGEKDHSKLTDEHIAPEGLQGTDILKTASCSTCACKTSYTERRILKGPLAAVRERFHWYGKRRKNRRPQTLPLIILRRDGTEETIELAASECPLAFRMPRFPAPRFLIPPQVDDSDFLLKTDYRKMDLEADETYYDKLIKADPGREMVLLRLEVFELSKLLAKIAYGYSVYFIGPYSVRPFVTNIITAPRDHAPSFLHYIGGAFEDGHCIEPLTTNALGKCVVRVETLADKQIVIARVQLLGMLNMPVYEVVVGEHLPFSGVPTIYVPTSAEPMKNKSTLLSESLGLRLALGLIP